MLNVYFDRVDAKVSGMEIVDNPVNLFDMLKIEGTSCIQLLLEKIEKAKYYDERHFITRFGEKVPIEFLSTGTKVAIVASLVKDKIIDLRECGTNARDMIFNYVDDASVLAYSKDYGCVIENLDREKEFMCKGYILKGMEQFADYVYRDYPNEPDSCLEV